MVLLNLEPVNMDELRLRAITAIDGLWFLAVEEKFGFEEALELDLKVWKTYGTIQIRRVSKALGITLDPANPPNLDTLNVLLETTCRIDGTECRGERLDDNSLLFTVYRCPWWENLKNSGRESLIPCERIDNTIFAHWLEHVDPRLSFRITRSMPSGHEACEWVIERRGSTGG